MGADTTVQYATSTKFYLQDRLAGHPWVTKLAFPVQVIERVETQDLVSNTSSSAPIATATAITTALEREFRGFAFVEQRDAEFIVGDFDLPPIVTKTWFHNGAWLEERALEAFFKDPANQEFFAGDPQATFLPDTDSADRSQRQRHARGRAGAEGQHPASGGLFRRRHAQGDIAL